MDCTEERATSLRRQIAETESELAFLKLQLLNIEEKDPNTKSPAATGANAPSPPEEDDLVTHGNRNWPLNLEEYKRYGRQMIVPDIGIQGHSL